MADSAVPSSGTKRRTRGGTKSFPLTPFEETVILAQTVHEHGVGGELRRVTVFDRVDKSPESGASRQLVTDSARYSLTTGSYGAEYLKLTADGAQVTDADTLEADRKRLVFELAIRRIEPFNTLYERLRGKKFPAMDVITDQLISVAPDDRARCANVFIANAKYLGLIRKQAGADRVIGIDEALEQVAVPQRRPTIVPEDTETDTPPPARAASAGHITSEPTIHIDLNIHIDQSASTDQIDQIFASMARHLYGKASQ